MSKEIEISENRSFEGVWIPRKLYVTSKFNPKEKFLLIEIKSLSKNGYCYAGNEHFSKFIGVSERQIQNMISKIKDLGYLQVKFKRYDNNPKQIEKRSLFLTDKFYDEFVNESENEGGEKNFTRGGEENCVENNIYNNNTNITNMNDMYAFSAKKTHRYINPNDYTEEDLIEHIEQPIKDELLDLGISENQLDERIKELRSLIVLFYREYHRRYGRLHKIITDDSYKRIVDEYVCPTDVILEDTDLEQHLYMMTEYFDTNYSGVEKSISHFMSSGIRANLFYKTCY